MTILEKYRNLAESLVPGRYLIPDQEPEKITKKTEKYSTTHYSIRIVDTFRGVEFKKIAHVFINTLRKDPDYIFAPTKEESVARQKAKTLEKRGVAHAMQDPEYLRSVRIRNMEEHGVEWVSQRSSVREKISKRNKENNNISHASKGFQEVMSDPVSKAEFIAKTRKTNIEKFGVDSPMKSQEIKDKLKSTLLERHGVDNAMKSVVVQDKVKATNLERYGFENASHSPEVRKKIKDSAISNGHVITVHNGMTIPDLAESLGCSYTHALHTIKAHGIDRGLQILEQFKGSKTSIEHIVEQILIRNGIQYLYRKKCRADALQEYIQDNNLKIGSSLMPDFQLVGHNVVIECDGLWYHCDRRYYTSEDGKRIDASLHRKYHFHKRMAYEHFGYKSLFFREDEILKSEGIVESIILNAIGKSKRIFGRETKVVKISGDFFVRNHLMGRPQRKTSFGLEHDGYIVAGMAFRWVSEKDRILEIDRFCTERGFSVVGGYSKLLKHAIREFNPNSVVTFVDLRYGSGSFLKDLGFVHEGSSPSFRWTSSSETYNRRKFLGSSGYENGLAKIWDCGQAKFVRYL